MSYTFEIQKCRIVISNNQTFSREMEVHSCVIKSKLIIHIYVFAATEVLFHKSNLAEKCF